MGKRSFKTYVEQELGPVAWFFIYALLEWFLIFVLFVDGFLSFFAYEFARFFELKIPCLFCTRIDHVMIRRNPNFYYNEAICEVHKKSLSCMAYCHVHKKLSDVRKLCESCLLSFAIERESGCDTETYKSVVGILHKDIDIFVDDVNDAPLSLPVGTKDQETEEAAGRRSGNRCLCCGKPLKSKTYSRSKSMGAAISQAPNSTPRAFAPPKHDEIRNLELSQVRYTELKLSEKDAQPSNDVGDGSNASRLENQYKTQPSLTEAEEGDDRTPTLGRGNKFFGIPLTDSASNTPRLMARLYKKTPDRTEYSSALESAEGSVPNEVDGELRQVHLDRRSLMDLCMELDEERNASAVAANNAMAMITRLQTEKAAVQMEALQYQRMMEEQAEYDQEALQEMNDLLLKREEDVRVLEAELEAYREKYGVLSEFSMLCVEEINEDYGGDFRPLSESISPRSSNDMPNGDQSLSSQDENSRETTHRSLKSIPGGKLFSRLNSMEKKPMSPAAYGIHSPKSSATNINRYQMEEMTGSKSEGEI